MRVRDFMTKVVQTTSPWTPAELAWEQMRKHRIRHLVVMRRGEACGVMSERDLGGLRGAMIRRNAKVEHLMSPVAVTVSADATPRQAANAMRGRGRAVDRSRRERKILRARGPRGQPAAVR
jgi:CBS domain-containing protein